MSEGIFTVFAAIFIGVLLWILVTRKTDKKLFATVFVLCTLIVAAVYLFRFGDLSSFTMSAFSSQAQFVRTKKAEVAIDAKEIKQLKEDSQKQAQEIQQAKNQILEVEKQAKQALPENRPVTQVTASMRLSIKGKPPFPYLRDKKDQGGNSAHLSLGESSRWQPGKSAPWVLNLVAKNVECSSSTFDADYVAEFQAEPLFNRINEPAGDFIDHVDFFELDPIFLPVNTHIDGGTITIKVNSTLSKSLPVPAQTYDLYNSIVDEWSLAHPSPWIELKPSPAPTPSP
jgi:hypothetical protein